MIDSHVYVYISFERSLFNALPLYPQSPSESPQTSAGIGRTFSVSNEAGGASGETPPHEKVGICLDCLQCEIYIYICRHRIHVWYIY